MQIYSNPKRADDPHALPDVEVFYLEAFSRMTDQDGATLDPGWYWWACFPGCLPDGDPIGPFNTQQEAIADAQEGADE